MKRKTCYKCGEEKDLSAFYKHKGMIDGHLGKCILCAKKYSIEINKEYRKKYSDAFNEQIAKGNIFDPDSFTKENKCFTNLKEDDGKTATYTQLCKPDCKFKFKKSQDKSKTDDKTDTTKK